MGEGFADGSLDPGFGPVGMLAAKEGGLVAAHGPIKLLGGAPALGGGHAAQDGNLFGARLFISQHRAKVVREGSSAKLLFGCAQSSRVFGGVDAEDAGWTPQRGGPYLGGRGELA